MIIPEHNSSAVDCTPSAQIPHTAAQPPHDVVEAEWLEDAPYRGAQLAAELGVAESTLRTRWLPWLERVAPIEMLKTVDGYTDLARSLALEFKQVPNKKPHRERWVAAAKQRYSGEFSPDGLLEEGLPGQLGSALALTRRQGQDIQRAADAQLAHLQALIDAQAQVEAEFDTAEVAAMRAAGAKRGIMRFQIEAEEEDAAYYQLRKLRSQKRGQG